MDRIRDAISRARPEPATPARSQQRPPAASPAAFNAAQATTTEVRQVTCDPHGFKKRRIISNEQDPVLNAYRVLRTRVLQKLDANNWKSIAVISPGAGAGKTVTAINLSIALASKAGVNPMLVDVDFYRPSVARYLGLNDFPSALDYFEGKRPLNEVVVKPDIQEMYLAPNERVTRRGAEFLNSERTDDLINAAVNEYGSRVVIFDMSPLLGCDDAIAFLPKVDCALLVAASGQTRVSELKEANRILSKTNIIGTVLNKSPQSLMPNPYY